MQRFARVPVHAASILKSAEAAIILERIRERTVGDQGAGQHTKASARFWKWSVPWMSLRQVQDKIKFLVKEGYAIRTQLYDAKGHRAESLYGITAKGLGILSIQVESDYIFPEIRKMHDKEVDAFLARKSTLGQNPNAEIARPNAETLARETAHLVESYEVKTLSKESSSLASLTRMSPDEQQPESASGISITAPSQTLAQTPDQPLSSRATPPPTSSAGPFPLVAETIYSHYPRKIGKADALKAIAKAIKQDGYQVILDATMEYASAVARWPDSEKQYVPHPSTWFNRASYLDDRSEWTKKCKRLPQSQSAKRFLSPAEMQAQEEAAARNYIPGFRS